MERTKGYIAILLYAIITGFVFYFSKIALDYASPTALLAYRFAIAVITLLIISVFQGEHVLPEKEIIKKVWPVTLVYPIGFFFFQIYGLKYLTSSQSIVSAFIPVMTLLWRGGFERRVGKCRSLFIGISVLGVVLIFALGQGAGGRFIREVSI